MKSSSTFSVDDIKNEDEESDLHEYQGNGTAGNGLSSGTGFKWRKPRLIYSVLFLYPNG